MLKKLQRVEGGLSPPGRALMDERPMLEDLASDHWVVIGVSVKRLCFQRFEVFFNS